MFVEIIRLFIVVLSTAAGYELARHGAVEPGNGVVLGATLGAMVGYVAGGIVGRLLRRAMGAFEHSIERAPAAQLLAGAVGAGALGLLSVLIGAPAVVFLPGRMGWLILGLVVWIGVYEGFHVGAGKSAELLGMAGLSTRPRFVPYGGEPSPDGVLADTSAIIDGRLLALVDAGFLHGNLLVARFVLDELQAVADAGDDVRRRRGRRGLEILDALQRGGRLAVQVVDDEVPEFADVDAKLVALARRLGMRLLTTDVALQRVAELQGVQCLNLNRLAEGMRPPHVAGDLVRVPIAREGKEPGQGVGFLDDGTMVVVGGAAGRVGQDVTVRITSNVQTSVGRMLFASLEA